MQSRVQPCEEPLSPEKRIMSASRDGERERRREQRNCCSRRIAVTKYSVMTVATMVVVALLISVSVHVVDGQRAQFSLGMRLKRFGQKQSQSLKQTDDFEEDEIVVKNDHILEHEKIDLAFEDLKLTLQTRKGTKSILDGSIRGRAKPGRMLAVMGPSGAGKSTVVHALAGRIKDNPKLKLFGRRYINGELVSGDSRIPAAFVEQDVTFFPHMTVRETLNFRVNLKLGSLLSKKARKEMVDELLDLVHLRRAADTIVGNNKVRGISGGERKRLSIAVEMIAAPSLIFLDEPTSGLDSTAATTLMQTLRELADRGKTVVAVIHQPSQHVFSKFDDVLLVAEGKQMYFGEVHNVRGYMKSYGCDATDEIGTAEHILDCITRMAIEDETEEDVTSRMQRLAEKARESTTDIDLGVKQVPNGPSKHIRHFASAGEHGPRANIFTQFALLLKRSFKEVVRGKTEIIIKAVQQVTLALIYGGIYSVGNDQASIQDRFGLFSLIAIGASNMAVAQAIRAFPKEKAIVATELADKLYRTLPYFVGKALSELPLVWLFTTIFGSLIYPLAGLDKTVGKFRRFLGLLGTHGLVCEATGLMIGAISPSSDVALALFPAVIVLNIIFDGKNISEEHIPKLLRWVPKIGLIRWGFEGLCVNEFDGLEFITSGPRRGPVAKTGAEALDRFGLGKNSVADVVRAQLTITASFWALSFLGLTLTRQRYLEMKSPEENGKDEK